MSRVVSVQACGAATAAVAGVVDAGAGVDAGRDVDPHAAVEMSSATPPCRENSFSIQPS
jgi:hypothetical protein